MMSGGYSGAVASPVCSRQSTPAASARRISSGRCACATTGLPRLCASVHHRAHFLHRHLVLIDQLDDVDLALDELPNFRARVVRAVDAPAVRLGAGIRRVLDERARHVHRRARNLAGVDAVARRDARLERAAEIARAGHAREQQLLRGGRKDHRFVGRRIRLVPVVVVGVTDDLQVDMHVPETGQHRHAFRRNHFRAGGTASEPTCPTARMRSPSTITTLF